MAFNEFIGNRGGIPLVAATQTTAGSATANAVLVCLIILSELWELLVSW